MSFATAQALLKHKFQTTAFVKDAAAGYVVAKEFNLIIDPEILRLATECWAEFYQDSQVDAVVGLPDAGSRLVPVLAAQLGVPQILPSKRALVIPGSWESVVSYSNYSFTTHQHNVQSHIGFVKPGMKVLLVDDVVAKGDTALAAIKALQAQAIEVVGLAVLFDKVWQGGVAKILAETGVATQSLVRINSITPAGEVLLQ